MPAPLIPDAVRRSLKETFGITRLHDGQQQVIGRVLAGQDTLAIMPTGAGKSLCYQLPALHLDGTTLVVSPLISLMKDQADKLEKAGFAVEQLNSALRKSEQGASMERIAGAQADIVFATPERLADLEFIEALKGQKIALLVVDEAHCISQWGHDFRPAFLEISQAIEALGRPPVLALTATAIADVIEDIRHQLHRPRMHVVNTGIYRPNLHFQVTQATREEEKFAQLLQALSNARGCGIVYTATVKACEEVHDRLVAAQMPVTRYHGKLSAAERHDNQDRFMSGQSRIMVATNAFGMGIDKADVRFVIHYQMPGTLESYYQEAGRAGRDGQSADCVLLFYRKDRQVQQFFLARRYPTVDDLQAVHAVLSASIAPLQLGHIAETLHGLSNNRVAVALKLLRDGGLATSNRSRAWAIKGGAGAPANATLERLQKLARSYEDKAERDQAALERMVFYAQTGFCRWRVLLEYFEEPSMEGERCGHCDNCLHLAQQPIADAARASPEFVLQTASFKAGDDVSVPRYGSGKVQQVTGGEVTVIFPDGAKRAFVAEYVHSA